MPILSASQIQTWIDCPRKWGFKYLDHVEVPTHPSAFLGTRVHEHQLDPYLMHGRGFDFTEPSGEIANALVPLLPKPETPALRIERPFEIPSPGGNWGYRGFIDLWAPDSGVVPGLEGGRPLLADFKTTSNLAYAQTSESLGTNIQAQLYSMALMFEDGVNELDLVWFYTRTRRPHKAQRVHRKVDAAHVAEQFERIEGVAAKIIPAVLTRPKVEDLRPNARMCDQYGGCPFRNRCNLSPSIHAEAINQEVKMNTSNFLDQLRKTAPAAPAPAAPSATPAMPALPPGVTMEQIQALLAAQAATVPQATAPAAHEQIPLPAWATAPVDPLKAAKVNPPESALPPAPPLNVAPPAPAEEPKKRGRPAKSATEASVLPILDGFPRTACATFLRALADWLA